MRRLPMSRLRPGMTLTKGVFSYAANSLLASGVVIDDDLIDLLQEAGLPAVIVEDDRLQNLVANELISDKTLMFANRAVRDVYRQARSGTVLDINKLRRVAFMLVDEVNLVPVAEQIYASQSNRTFNEYLHEHLVQVAILAICVGRQRSYTWQKLNELALAALLMDIGQMVILQSAFEKEERLSSAELDELKRHCLLGFYMTREYVDVSLETAAGILHHSERSDGSGYPQGLKEDQIHEYGRILAVCDSYDSLVTEKRYRRRYLPYQTLSILQAGIRQIYDFQVVQDFAMFVTPYPLGSIVELSTGDIAAVVGISRENILRPNVRLLMDRQRNLIDSIMEINLLDMPQIQIAKNLEDNSYPVMWHSLLY